MNRITNYFKSFQNDLSASIVVFLVALPLCIGIAVGSGLSVFSGLIAGIIGGIVTGVLSGSHLSISGPAAGLITIIAASLLKLPAIEAIFLSIMIAGIIQLVLGYLGAGIIGDYVPRSVVKGMLAAIGIILVLKEIPHLIGYDVDYVGDLEFQQTNKENTFSELAVSLSHISPSAAAIGLLCLVSLFSWDWVIQKYPKLKLIPGQALVVLLAVVLQLFLLKNNPSLAIPVEHMLQVPVTHSAEEFLQLFHFPNWSFLNNKEVWTTAFVLALVASLETLLSVEAVDTLDPYKRVTPTNRELKAQGISNLVSGFLGGLPITSVIVRSSANVSAGAKTKVSSILHGLFLLIFVMFLAAFLNLIPIAAMAAILIHTGYKLAKPSLFKYYFQKGLDQFIPFVITVASILFIDLLYGVLIGIVSGLFFVMKSNFHTALFVLKDKNHFIFKLRKDVSFLNKPILKRKLEEVPADSAVIIDLTGADYIDQDVRAVIHDFSKHAVLKNIELDIREKPSKEKPKINTVQKAS